MPKTPKTVEVGFVAPRHLASGGDPAWIAVPLHRACGWSYSHDPLMPRVMLTSPDQRTLLRLEPAPDAPWWSLRHAPGPGWPAWSASFDARTPVEIIAALADALTAPDDAPAGTAVSDPFEPLRQADWDQIDDGMFTSPDGHVQVDRFVLHGSDRWFITTSLSDDPGDWVWQARLDATTPAHLITPLIRALADPAPLRRDLRALPRWIRPHVQTATAPVGPADLPDPLEQRVRYLAARHARPAPPPPPHRPELHRRTR